MHKLESVFENETHNILLDFEINTHHPIKARRPDPVLINKKKKRSCHIVDFKATADHKVKFKEGEKLDKYFDLARELKKL